MSKISTQSAHALHRLHEFTLDNTKVSITTCGSYVMSLFGNQIAHHDHQEQKLILYDGGWQSRTTKDRLNAILDEFQIPYFICQENYKWYIINNYAWRKQYKWPPTGRVEIDLKNKAVVNIHHSMLID